MDCVCSSEKCCVSLLPRTILDAELLIVLLLLFLIGSGMDMCYAFSIFTVLRGCLIHLNHRGQGWEDCPKALALGFALPSISAESIDLPALPGCSPNL